MQTVVWGAKAREVRVPVGWMLLTDGVTVMEKDMYFDPKTHAFKRVSPEDIKAGKKVSSNFIAIRLRGRGCASDMIPFNIYARRCEC